MKDPNVIDAEFTVVGEAPTAKWNGVGLPPAWGTWGLLGKATYLLTFALIMTAGWLFFHWLAHFIGMPR